MNKGDKVSVLVDTLLKSTNIKMLLGILCLLTVTTLLDYTETDVSAESGLILLDDAYGQLYQPSPTAAQQQSWQTMWQKYRRSVEGQHGDSLRDLMVLQVWGNTYVS